MALSLKDKQNELSISEFGALLANVKASPSTMHFFAEFDPSYFFMMDNDSNQLLVQLHQDEWQINQLIDSFSAFGQKEIIFSLLIDEIVASAKLSNIDIDSKEVYSLLNKLGSSSKKEVASLSVPYVNLLLNAENYTLKEHNSIRMIYDQLMDGVLQSKDKPNGWTYRNSILFNDIKSKQIHDMYDPELKIMEAMTDFFTFVNNDNVDIYLRIVLGYFLLNTIHPFYDGNGRLSRFVMSMVLYQNTSSYCAFALSQILSLNKQLSVESFERGQDPLECGCLNLTFATLAQSLHEGFEAFIESLKEKQITLFKVKKPDFSKSEMLIYNLIREATILGKWGISSNDILQCCDVSRRTLVSTLQKFRDMGLVEETRFSRSILYRLTEFR